IQHIRQAHGALPACLLSGRGTDAGGPDQPQLPTETAPPITVLNKPLSITALHHFLLETYQQVQRR
ncbi:MAG: hypothetical protein VX201_16855, partial [Pseudomonadota bacterium]|nr:hypothetical protein [Pseudomonadota bacterium]